MREIVIDQPIEYQQDPGARRIRHEEDVLCWLWAFPSLLPWSRPVVWLYTPVVGNARWPGDLWGVDSRGEFLVVECKRCERYDDPFRDFQKFHSGSRTELSAAHWVEKFMRHLKAELAFPNGVSERPKNKTDGILPRSNRRAHIRRWPHLADIIDRYIRSPQYKITACTYLKKRAAAQDPTPYYLALMVVSAPKNQVLNKRGIYSGQKLQKIVGAEHVGVVTVKARVLHNNQIRIIIDRQKLLEGL